MVAKIQCGYQKRRIWFQIYWKRCAKNHTKKVINEEVIENFSIKLLLLCATFFAIFKRIRNQHQLKQFLILIPNFSKKRFLVLSANFKATHSWSSSNIWKLLWVCFNSILHPYPVCYDHFCQKSQNQCILPSSKTNLHVWKPKSSHCFRRQTWRGNSMECTHTTGMYC